ncbi:phosphonoacetaldehyde reductase [Paenibacillus planticolens]|uniref:Iron-containing alcohol dehydrogenase n=1 Tax=Paenibacillus planticolens TaxID=2654976 RepID=A0ABX1ZUL9_9BACL|nr:phosphonoacetaldehyde reductase [Paenibacillus planticolens]NOV03747.1 iron-containing alcohol dehydrogenase [Paenibacillus planticolens]
MNQFYNPVAVSFGSASAESFANLFEKRYADIKRVLLLTRGAGVEKSDCLQPVMNTLSLKETSVIEVTLNNPNVADILKLKQEIGSFDYELIVAIGGGSVMDAAKVLSALQSKTYQTAAEVREAITSERYREEPHFTPWIGIPTTSGTGSEVTSWATVWDEEHGSKYSVSDERLYASAAFILPELTVTMPLRLSVATALDALCHATEAYWSVHTNAITRVYSLEAIERIRRTLPLLIEQPDNLVWREQLSLASVLAGMAFSNTRTTACHSISYPLTMLYGIDHGIAASITLASVMRHNLDALIEPDKLMHAFGAADMDEVDDFIRNIYNLYGLSSSLGQYGVTVEGIRNIVSHSYTKGRMDNNPVEISPEELERMLVSLL